MGTQLAQILVEGRINGSSIALVAIGIALIWGVMALLCVIAGMLVRPVLLNSYISAIGMILIMMAVLCVIVGAYFISLRISELMRKTQELSINVTLLYDENLRLMKQVEELTDKLHEDEK